MRQKGLRLEANDIMKTMNKFWSTSRLVVFRSNISHWYSIYFLDLYGEDRVFHIIFEAVVIQWKLTQ